MRTVQAILHSYYTGIRVPGSSYPFSFCYTNIPHIPNSGFFFSLYIMAWFLVPFSYFGNLMHCLCCKVYLQVVHVNDVHILTGLSIIYANLLSAHYLNNSLKCIM